ncbi:hypothetical protein N7528_006701 [Penicillium herquei]|nr:hypothetical protein N7528_006701 [Penicillium herquei]
MSVVIESPKSRRILEEPEFKVHRKKGLLPAHLLVPSVDVESAAFSQFPRLASCYVRQVIKPRTKQSSF